MAGLRTNALVALGAACYVVFSQQFPNEVSPTRVAAQVVSGIGFLGAGIIFRHGFTVHGLNTAATLWCSAAVGLMAGGNAPLYAILATGMIIFVNLGLRPLVKWLKRKTRAGLPLTFEYRLTARCAEADEKATRAQILQLFANQGLQVTGFEREVDKEEVVTLEVQVEVGEKTSDQMNKIISPLMLSPGVISADWDSSVE